MKSIENECLDTLLIQLQPDANSQPTTAKQPDEEKKKPEPSKEPSKKEEAGDGDALLDGQKKEEKKKKKRMKCLNRKFWLDMLDSPLVRKYFGSIGSESQFYLVWLSIVSLFYVYNLIGISIRFSFHYDAPYRVNKSIRIEYNNQTAIASFRSYLTMFDAADYESVYMSWSNNRSNDVPIVLALNESQHSILLDEEEVEDDGYRVTEVIGTLVVKPINYWLFFDYLSDFVSLVDMLLVQTRIKYLKEGSWVSDLKSTALNYFRSWKFKIDMVSLIPFDLVQLFIGINSLTRLNRFIKLHTLWEFFDRWDRSIRNYVFLVRLFKLLTYFLIIIHFYACAYYTLSDWEIHVRNIQNNWVYVYNHTNIQKY